MLDLNLKSIYSYRWYKVMSSFKKEEKFIIDLISDITKSEFNINLYKDMFKKMNDKDFTIFMEKLRDGSMLNIIIDTDISKNKISIENNLKIAKKLNKPLFQYLYTKMDKDSPLIKSKYKYFLQLLPFRRTKQTTDKGVRVSEDNKHFDIVTGQPSGVSTATKISNPEAQILVGMGLEKTTKELLINRSDSAKSSIMVNSIKKYGMVNDSVVENYSEQTRTSKTLKAYLAGMHLKMNL